MAKLVNTGQAGLPPPPAPTRRGANPWLLSGTARKRESPPPAELDDLMDELRHGDESSNEQPPLAPEPEYPTRSDQASQPQSHPAPRESGPWPLFVLLLGAGLVYKILSVVLKGGDWRFALAPIIILLFIGQAWWRLRERRRRQEEQRLHGRG